MRLRRLTLRNFRAWKEQIIDFGHGPGDVGHAVVNGENGAGKSSLIEGILWVLYGTTRSSAAGSVLRTGAADVFGEVEFNAGPVRYMVRRKYTARGKGRGELHLYRQAGAQWMAASEGNKRETQAAVVALIGVDEEAMLASAFARQGHPGLAAAQPEDRRRVLRKALGLEPWAELARQK